MKTKLFDRPGDKSLAGLCLVALTVFVGAMIITHCQPSTPPQVTQSPLAVEPQNVAVPILNAGFEDEYTEREASQVIISKHWQSFYKDNQPPPQEGGYAYRPEYKPIPAAVYPYRVRSGDMAQCWFAFQKVMDGGIYQVVPVEKGETYQFTVWAQAWSTNNSDEPRESPGELYVGMGIDPYGRTAPWELGVIWHEWARVTADYQQFESPPVKAESDQITLYIRAWNKWALKHNDIYVDDAALMKLESGGEPEPLPTYTPYPTYTPAPTCEPCPTCSPVGTPVPGGCPSLEDVRGVVREEIERILELVRFIPVMAQ